LVHLYEWFYILSEVGDDPSTHPMVKPMFMERSRSEMKLRDNRRSFYVLDSHSMTPIISPMKKSNSCSTIFLDDSTISQPNLKNTIKCISLAIYYHIANRKNRSKERLMEIFEERLHPITREPMPADYVSRDPDHRQIYRFIRTLFHAAQLTAECAIITLVGETKARQLFKYVSILLFSSSPLLRLSLPFTFSFPLFPGLPFHFLFRRITFLLVFAIAFPSPCLFFLLLPLFAGFL
uniref:Cyclin N-terminal domain-containing protein n=1 Tax=Toxocara canis TaxID=6265 RepID=A0A183U3E0_TOXCA